MSPCPVSRITGVEAELVHIGTEVAVYAGDVTYTPDGGGHGIEAVGDEPVEMIAMILYS